VPDAPARNFDADQCVEDADADERQQVAGEEYNSDGKSTLHPSHRPLGVARDELVTTVNDERPLPVYKDPRHKDGDRK